MRQQSSSNPLTVEEENRKHVLAINTEQTPRTTSSRTYRPSARHQVRSQQTGRFCKIRSLACEHTKDPVLGLGGWGWRLLRLRFEDQRGLSYRLCGGLRRRTDVPQSLRRHSQRLIIS